MPPFRFLDDLRDETGLPARRQDLGMMIWSTRGRKQDERIGGQHTELQRLGVFPA
jgi:hypothetical protein